MAQHVSLNTETPKLTINSVTSNRAGTKDSVEIEPFSSQLNKQIDKHVKTKEPSENKTGKTVPDSDEQLQENVKAERVGEENGKELPNTEKTEVNDEQGDDGITVLVESNLKDTPVQNEPKTGGKEVSSIEKKTAPSTVLKDKQVLTAETVSNSKIDNHPPAVLKNEDAKKSECSH
jgi:hypothetical protein